MDIEIDEYVSLISYKSDKILVLCGNLSEQTGKTETNILMEIDLKMKLTVKQNYPLLPAVHGYTTVLHTLGTILVSCVHTKNLKTQTRFL